MYQLSKELQALIYSFDNTYKLQFYNVLKELNIAIENGYCFVDDFINEDENNNVCRYFIKYYYNNPMHCDSYYYY
jgi:ABC-type sulfate transport system substrate-binding protein